jgi:hypothetical protein
MILISRNKSNGTKLQPKPADLKHFIQMDFEKMHARFILGCNCSMLLQVVEKVKIPCDLIGQGKKPPNPTHSDCHFRHSSSLHITEKAA